MPAQKLARVAVYDEGERGPAVSTCPDPAEVRRPAFVRRGCHGRHSLDAGPHPGRPLADLQALDLEDALYGVLVETQEPGQSIEELRH